MKKIVLGVLLSLLVGSFAFAAPEKDFDYYLAHPLEKINTGYLNKQCYNDNINCFNMMNEAFSYNGEEYIGMTFNGIPAKKSDANYGVFIFGNATKKVLEGGDTVSFKILGDGKTYRFTLSHLDFENGINEGWYYNIKTKKDQVMEVTIPLKKMRFANPDNPKKFVKDDITAMFFTLEASASTANKEFNFSVFDLKAF